jgi:hypothetical protein
MEVTRQIALRNDTFMDSKLPKTAAEYFAIRETFAVQLRKKKRLDQAHFKRLKLAACSLPISPEQVLVSLQASNLASVKALRQYLCSPQLNFELICKTCPEVVKELAVGLRSGKEELVLESSWCLTNLALGPPGLVNDIAELIPEICGYVLRVTSKIIAEQCCWLLGNLAAESLRVRDKIKEVCGLLKAICNLFRFNNPSLSSVACWTLCNLIRSQSPDSSIFVEAGAVNPVLEYIHRPESTDLCTDSLWFLTYLTVNTGPAVIQSVMLDRHFNRLVELLSISSEVSVRVPILRIIGNVVTYGANPAAIVRFAQLRDAVLACACGDVMEIQREAFWLLSNAFGKSFLYTEWFVEHVHGRLLVEKLARSMDSEAENDLKVESCIALYNLAEGNHSAYIRTVLAVGGADLIDAVCKNLADIPFWFVLQVQGVSDIDRLLSSIGLLHLSLEFSAACTLYLGPDQVEAGLLHKLHSAETFSCIETFALQYAGRDTHLGASETFMKDLCADLLRRFYSEYTSEVVFS